MHKLSTKQFNLLSTSSFLYSSDPRFALVNAKMKLFLYESSHKYPYIAIAYYEICGNIVLIMYNVTSLSKAEIINQ